MGTICAYAAAKQPRQSVGSLSPEFRVCLGGCLGRDDVQVFSDPADDWLVTLVLTFARCPDGEPVFVEVAPGNARSLRAVLVCSFRPLGA
jgi:hypothetical protein